MRERARSLRIFAIIGVVVLFNTVGSGHFGLFAIVGIIVFVVVGAAMVSGVARFNQVFKGAVDVRGQLARAMETASTAQPNAVTTPVVDPTTRDLDQLERLGKLHREGHLTDAEFAAA
jgi:hypothetical protein